MLGRDGEPSLKAGVPPDAFCDDGQFWGNPIYDWDKMKAQDYQWWQDRISYAFELFDIIRIDHFRAFDRYYAIPADAETAKEGEWIDGPKMDLFAHIEARAIVAEDLGVIDDGVRDLLKATGYPGMKVFEFAFDGNPENEYLPSKYSENCVAYTGTHDNDTLRSFIESMEPPERKDFEKALKLTREEFRGLEPMYTELKVTTAEIDSKVPIHEALDNMAERSENKFLIRFADYYKIASAIGTKDARENLLGQAYIQFEEERVLRALLKKEISEPKRDAMMMIVTIPVFMMFGVFVMDGYWEFISQEFLGKLMVAAVAFAMILLVWFLNAKIGGPLK